MVSEAQVDALLAKLRAEDGAFTRDERSQLAGIVESFAHVVELAASGRTSEIGRFQGSCRVSC